MPWTKLTSIHCSGIENLRHSNKKVIQEIGLTPAGLGELIRLISSKYISGRIAKELLPELLGGGWDGSVRELVDARGMQAINDPTEIEAFVRWG